LNNNIDWLVDNFTIEELSRALYQKCERRGIHKGTDKTKWREAVTADKLNHNVFEKISAGKDSDKYGADAYDPLADKNAEYKSQAIVDKEVRNLCEHKKNSGSRFSPLTIRGVYNGAYTQEAIDSYYKNDHYFTTFYKEEPLIICRIDPDIVRNQLEDGLSKMEEKRKAGKKVTTNCNSVSVSLGDTDSYEISYRNDEWFENNQ